MPALMPAKSTKLPRKKIYHTTIVGGGIVGLGIFRDLALHQVDTLLIDKGDFSSQTSQSSSKMLHGGIRYLEQMDFALIHEALAEKNLWLRLAPHLCRELPFHLPIYQFSKFPPCMVRMGLAVYDLLSGLQNTPHYYLNAQQTHLAYPTLLTTGLKGAGVYYDAIVDDAKLGLECLYDALISPSSEACNYCEITHVERHQYHFTLYLRDTLSGEKSSIETRELVWATGPFTDQLLTRMNFAPWTPKLLLSKGSHIWLRPSCLPITHPMVLQTPDGRIIFVIPQRDLILVGTTEDPVRNDLFNIKATAEEVQYLLSTLQQYFPTSQIGPQDIVASFAGVRPLVRADGPKNNSGRTSRAHHIYQPFSNMYVIVGGKYTTFRTMGQEISEMITRKLHIPYFQKLTQNPLRQKSVVPCFDRHTQITPTHIRQILQQECPRTFEDLIKRRLGLISTTLWNETQPTSFKDFFQSLYSELSAQLAITPEDLK